MEVTGRRTAAGLSRPRFRRAIGRTGRGPGRAVRMMRRDCRRMTRRSRLTWRGRKAVEGRRRAGRRGAARRERATGLRTTGLRTTGLRTTGLRAVTDPTDRVFAAGSAFFDPPFWARRARFHALRAAAATLRARFASRFASLRRLRARFSSSLARRTRCLATSACRRTRSGGSVVEPCSLAVFFICGSRSERPPVSHKAPPVSTLVSYPQYLCITMWTDSARACKRRCGARACVGVNAISPAALATHRRH